MPVLTVNSMRISAPSSSVQSTRSGFRISTSPTVLMSPAVTMPGPVLRRVMRFGPSPCILTAIALMLRTMSVTSSRTPGIEENSCSTPSIWTAVTAAPWSDDSSTRRSALPSVSAEAALERLGDHGAPDASGRRRPSTSSLFGLDQILPVLLDHDLSSRISDRRRRLRGRRRRLRTASWASRPRRGDACADGSHCAGSASRRGSRSR